MGLPIILAGFELDCNALFIKFEKLSTVRYIEFAQVWKEMNFSLIFSGRRVKELVCFTTEALSYTKYFFMQTDSFLRRVCALYIIYGIYYKQPVRHASKIYVTMEEWLEIKEFAIILRENNHDDTLFILFTLIFDNAFEFSATNSIRYTPVSCRGMIHTIYEQLHDIEELDLNYLTKNLENVEQEYKESKLILAKSFKIPYINYANDNISQNLQEIIKSKPLNIDKNTVTPQPGTSKQADESYAEKRNAIRNEFFRRKRKGNLRHYNSCVFGKNENLSDDELP